MVPIQVLGELFQGLVHKAGKSRADARNALSSGRHVFPVIETSLDGRLTATDLAVDHNLGVWDAVILSAASRSGCRLLLSEDLPEGFTWAGGHSARSIFLKPLPVAADLVAEPVRRVGPCLRAYRAGMVSREVYRDP